MRYAPVVLCVFGVGGAIGMLGWVVAGRPEEFLWSAFACGIATTAIFMAGALWRLRAALRDAWLGPVRDGDRTDVYDNDRPSSTAAPGTAAERTADLLRCAEGHITIDDYLDRWVGRPLMKEPVDATVEELDRQILGLFEMRAKILEELLSELRRPGAPEAAPSCTHCLGIHEPSTCPVAAGTEDPVSGETPFVAAVERVRTKTYVVGERGLEAVGPGFSVGDRVRLRRDDRIVKLISVELCASTPPRWTVEFGGSTEHAYESHFVIALPRNGEVWGSKECHVCAMKWQQKWPEFVSNITFDWPDAPALRGRISCGCLYRIGMQDGPIGSWKGPKS